MSPLYLQAKARALETEEEIRNALKYLDGRVVKKPHSVKGFLGDMPSEFIKRFLRKYG